MTAPTLYELEYAEVELDPDGEMDPAERTRVARDRLAERAREADEELASSSTGCHPADDDWSWPAIVARCKAATEDRSRSTGAAASPLLIVAAAQLVDLLIEGAAQADVRDVDLARFVDLPAVALSAVREAWAHPERLRE